MSKKTPFSVEEETGDDSTCQMGGVRPNKNSLSSIATASRGCVVVRMVMTVVICMVIAIVVVIMAMVMWVVTAMVIPWRSGMGFRAGMGGGAVAVWVKWAVRV